MGRLNAKAHEWLSRGALLPLWRWQRAVRPSRRAAVLSYTEGLRFRRQSAAWDDERKRAWVLERLRLIVRRAARETDYYGELFRRVGFDAQADFSFSDFARLPVLEREDIWQAGERICSRAVPAAELQKDSTGGSTGRPTEIWLGPEETGWRESGLEYPLERAGVPTGIATAFFWGHHLDPLARDTLLKRYHDFETNRRWFDCFRLSPDVLERYHREFERWRPACIIAYASALGALAEYVNERGYETNYPTRCFVTGAEKLLPKHRATIEATFRRPVHERYGSRDAGLMAFQFNPRASLDYEIDWSNVLLEPETGGTDSPILVTKLHADAMPMLRYRIGDVGRFPAGSRPGEPALSLREVLGRELDRIWLPDGRWVQGEQMPHMLKDHPVREFMFLQRPDYSVELRIVPRGVFGDASRREILSTVAANLPSLDVSLVLVESIPRTRANKWRPVVSEVQPPKGEAA